MLILKLFGKSLSADEDWSYGRGYGHWSIKLFSAKEIWILKWTLNRPVKAKSTNSLIALADVKSSDEGYKSNRPSQILNSEKSVENIMNIMTEEYINLFDGSRKICLYNLSSGIQVES